MRIKLFSKISVWRIIKSHWQTMINDNSKRVSFDDLATFILIPIVVASFLIYKNIILDDKATNIIITALSILVGLLFNVIVLVFDIASRTTDNPVKSTFLKQILSNISFSILVSIITIVFSLLSLSEQVLIKNSASWFVYLLSTNFLLTVLMILKRMYALFGDELDK